MQTTNVAFFHGWGLSAKDWREYQHPCERLKTFSVDRGYFGEPTPELPASEFNSADQRILVTHSFGLHLVPKEVLASATKLVIFGGFLSFDRYARKRGQTKIETKAMRQMLRRNPRSVLEQFYVKSGLDAKRADEISDLNIGRLSDDLELIDQVDLAPEAIAHIGKIEILHALQDKVVPVVHAAKLAEEIPHSALRIHPLAGHAFPFQDSRWCLNSIAELGTLLTKS